MDRTSNDDTSADASDTDVTGDAPLSARDLRILDFEGSWWLHPGPKDAAVQEHLGMSSTRYYQAIRRLMDDPRAMQHAPLTVRRLQKMRRTRLEQIADRVRGGSSG